MTISLPALAERLRVLRRPAAEEATRAFLERHPDWIARYGELARVRGEEDAAYHVDFLAGALRTGSAAAFEDYARWAARVLEARRIPRAFLEENLVQVEEALARHVTSEEAAALRHVLAAGRAALGASEPAPAPTSSASSLGQSRDVFLHALLSGNRRGASGIAVEALRTHPPEEVYVEIFQGALYEVGRLWESNRVTVADEHLATALAQFILAEIYPLLPVSGPRRGRALVTGIEGELHQIGAHMVADILETRGWDVRFLGSNAPRSSVLEAVERHGAELVGLSATMLFNLPQVARLVAEIRSSSRRPMRIILGGSAFRHAPGLYRELGADAFAADLRELLRLEL